nr:MAG TPA: hypothetical protein [Caudoviricetes sp.]
MHKYTSWNTKDYYILLDSIKTYIFSNWLYVKNLTYNIAIITYIKLKATYILL